MASVFLAFISGGDVSGRCSASGWAWRSSSTCSSCAWSSRPRHGTLLGDRAWWLPGWLDRICPTCRWRAWRGRRGRAGTREGLRLAARLAPSLRPAASPHDLRPAAAPHVPGSTNGYGAASPPAEDLLHRLAVGKLVNELVEEADLLHERIPDLLHADAEITPVMCFPTGSLRYGSNRLGLPTASSTASADQPSRLRRHRMSSDEHASCVASAAGSSGVSEQDCDESCQRRVRVRCASRASRLRHQPDDRERDRGRKPGAR